jgi:hypothetical protein
MRTKTKRQKPTKATTEIENEHGLDAHTQEYLDDLVNLPLAILMLRPTSGFSGLLSSIWTRADTELA